MKKKPAGMTFKEFFEKAKEQGIDNKMIEEVKHFMLDILHQEGFTNEQITEMEIDKAWSFIRNHLVMFFEEASTEADMAIKQRKITPMQLQILENLHKFLEHQAEELKKEEEQQRRKE